MLIEHIFPLLITHSPPIRQLQHPPMEYPQSRERYLLPSSRAQSQNASARRVLLSSWQPAAPYKLPRHATRAIRANEGAMEQVSMAVLPVYGMLDFLSFPQLPAATGMFLLLPRHHMLIPIQFLRVQNLHIHGCRRQARPCTSKRASRATGQCCDGT